ncbi:FecR domain-containing protein [Porticoccus sp. W117]|uniref:FecR family protein n=1 Tax=Porticoccus sp. W117 TaxID=3054777 RepID=UPI00259A3E52|nr:FecR domain-containing protein [Porticoccus sp. W117]MDM3869749.1 FecR domain-containing protein [Porticoccus sp. W117]
MINKFKKMLALEKSSEDIVKLYADEVTPEEKQRISNWKNESPEYADHFLATNHLISDLEILASDADIQAAVSSSDKSVPVSQGSRKGWQFMAVAASLLLAVVVVFQLWPEPKSIEAQVDRYVTRVGEQKSITLEDGTSINLNTATELLVMYTANSREVTLRRGEAYFDVVSDPGKPFTVAAGARSVTVLGTEFNLYRAPDKLKLAVTEGLVSIHDSEIQGFTGEALTLPKDGSEQLLPSASQYHVGVGGVVELDVKSNAMTANYSENLSRLTSWKKGVVRFDAAPLSDVVKELNRYSGKKILIEDADAMALRLFATIHLDRIDDAIDVIEMSLPIRVVRHFDRVVISKDPNSSN